MPKAVTKAYREPTIFLAGRETNALPPLKGKSTLKGAFFMIFLC